MKKVISLFGLFAYIVGTIGGFGYAAYCKAWFIACCVAALGVMAFPTLLKFWKELNNE